MGPHLSWPDAAAHAHGRALRALSETPSAAPSPLRQAPLPALRRAAEPQPAGKAQPELASRRQERDRRELLEFLAEAKAEHAHAWLAALARENLDTLMHQLQLMLMLLWRLG